MNPINEQLDQLWGGQLAEDTRANFLALSRGLVEMEKDAVHDTDTPLPVLKADEHS